METSGYVVFGNRVLHARYSPTPLAIEEMFSEHSTNVQQEPKITAFVSQDPNMIKAFKEGKDIYATIASIAFNTPYENCLEFHPETHEYQPDGKARRGEAKTIVLGRPKGFCEARYSA